MKGPQRSGGEETLAETDVEGAELLERAVPKGAVRKLTGPLNLPDPRGHGASPPVPWLCRYCTRCQPRPPKRSGAKNQRLRDLVAGRPLIQLVCDVPGPDTSSRSNTEPKGASAEDLPELPALVRLLLFLGDLLELIEERREEVTEGGWRSFVRIRVRGAVEREDAGDLLLLEALEVVRIGEVLEGESARSRRG